jgi:hypothetical protein
MKFIKLSLLSGLWASLVSSSIVFAESEDAIIEDCPSQCNIDLAKLNNITGEIISNKASLQDGSCVKSNSGVNSKFTFKYKFEVDDEVDQTSRRAQSLTDDPMVINKPPRGINPHPNHTQSVFGWHIETHANKTGSCLTAPNNKQGPFSAEAMETCMFKLDFACYRIQQSTCPCYDIDDVVDIEAKLRSQIYDPDFVLDLKKSCKDPNKNGGLPFGLYKKQNGKSSKITLGVSINKEKEMMDKNKCYSKNNDMARLSLDQQKQCVSLMEFICSGIKKLPKPDKTCKDDPEYKYKNKPKRTCAYLMDTKRKRNRNCQKYDPMTGKLVFQHCRESCEKCTCRNSDNSDFYFNGQANMNCQWIKILEKNEKEMFCKDDDVAKYCPSACGKPNAKCCKNDSDFSFFLKRRGTITQRKMMMMKCGDIGNANYKEICNMKRVALRCPMACLRCFIQPRI